MTQHIANTQGTQDPELEGMPTLDAHRIDLLFGFKFPEHNAHDHSMNERLRHAKLQDVAYEERVHPTRLTAEAQRPIGHRPLWNFVDFGVSSDLHPFVQNIFNSGLDIGNQTRCYRLSAYGLNLLNGKYRLPATSTTGGINGISGLSINGAFTGEPFRLLIDSLSLHLFQTHFGVAVMSMKIVTEDPSGPNAGLLVELLQRLCEERSAGHLSWARNEADRQLSKPFTAASLIAPLLEASQCKLVPRKRTYSFCAMSFDKALPTGVARDLSCRLSRHYNFHYRPVADFNGTIFVQPFENVLHALSREGACTIVEHRAEDGTPVEFLKTWLNHSHVRVYLPLQIAAFHEHTVLLDLAQGSGMHIDLHHDREAETKKLRTLCGRFLIFRLRYRLSQISSLTSHDLVYEATRDALGLAALSEKISLDMFAVERRLLELNDARRAKEQAQRDKTVHRLERKFSLLSTLGSAGITYLTLTGVAEHFLNQHHEPNSSFILDTVVQGIALFAAFCAGYYNQQHQRLITEPNDEILEHEGKHMAIDAAAIRKSAHSHDRLARGI